MDVKREESVAYLDIDTFALFDRSAVVTWSAGLRYVTFARRHDIGWEKENWSQAGEYFEMNDEVS